MNYQTNFRRIPKGIVEKTPKGIVVDISNDLARELHNELVDIIAERNKKKFPGEIIK